MSHLTAKRKTVIQTFPNITVVHSEGFQRCEAGMGINVRAMLPFYQHSDRSSPGMYQLSL